MKKKPKMTTKTTFKELAELQGEQLANQPPATLEDIKAQFDKSKKRSEKSFALSAPKAQEDLKKITTPLSFDDARRIGTWLFRKQITTEMIPKDVLVEWQQTEMCEYITKRIEEVNKRELKMTVKTTWQEHAKLAMEQISKQQPTTLEKARAQVERLRKQSEKSFALAAPEIQEDVKKMTTPLNFQDSAEIYRCLIRRQITFDIIPKDVLEEFKKTEHYQEVMRRFKGIDEGCDF